MALFDQILSRTGAVRARINGIRMRAARDEVLQKRPLPPTRTVIILEDGKRIIFDVAKDIQHNFPSKVTEFPVEDKSNVSDHVVNQNPTFSVSGIFSDGARDMLSVPNNLKESEVYQQLLKIRDDRKTISLLTPLDTYIDLVVTNIGIPKSAEGGRALRVELQFTKIRKVSSELTTVFVKSKGSTKKATAKDDTALKLEQEKKAGDIKKSQDNLGSAVKLIGNGVERSEGLPSGALD